MSQPSSTQKGFPAKAPCVACGQAFRVKERRQVDNVCCSRTCDAVRRRAHTTKTCSQCKLQLPYERFPLNAWGTRASSCEACYRPRKPSVLPLVDAPHPCGHCGLPFSLREAPSRIKTRKYCSKWCSSNVRAKPSVQCKTCRKSLPRDDFDYIPCGQKLAASCRQCSADRVRLLEAGIGYSATFGYMLRIAKNIASKRKVPFEVTAQQAEALYNSPCDMCGKPATVLACQWPELGFVEGNTLCRCWPCARWSGARSTTRYGQVQVEDIVRHARAVVAWADSR